MKKLLLALALFAIVSATKAQEAGHSNAVKLNPLSLFLATGNVSYERAVSHNQSFQLGGFYSNVGLGGIKYSGFGLTPEYRIYFGGHKQALNGVYAAPFVRYQNFTLKDKSSSDKATYSTIGGGATLGWEKTSASGFVIDLFVGPSYNKGTFKNNSNQKTWDVNSAFNGFTIRTGITLGFAF